eukprot:SAG11_NODE_7942_length_1079_cov_1.084694_1_plen_38_part_01
MARMAGKWRWQAGVAHLRVHVLTVEFKFQKTKTKTKKA